MTSERQKALNKKNELWNNLWRNCQQAQKQSDAVSQSERYCFTNYFLR